MTAGEPGRVPPTIPDDEISFEFYRSSGPGGQNVNKVETAVRVRFALVASRVLDGEQKARLARLAGRRVTDGGELIIEAHRHRTREKNREDGLERLAHWIARAPRAAAPAPEDQALPRRRPAAARGQAPDRGAQALAPGRRRRVESRPCSVPNVAASTAPASPSVPTATFRSSTRSTRRRRPPRAASASSRSSRRATRRSSAGSPSSSRRRASPTSCKPAPPCRWSRARICRAASRTSGRPASPCTARASPEPRAARRAAGAAPAQLIALSPGAGSAGPYGQPVRPRPSPRVSLTVRGRPDTICRPLGGRSMVGHAALDRRIGVRVPASQPSSSI